MNESIRSLFPVTEKYIYMNHAAVSPLSTRVRDAMVGITDDVMRHGTANYDDWYRTYELARSAAARLVNARAHEIAFMQNTSAAILRGQLVAKRLSRSQRTALITVGRSTRV